MAHRVAVRVTEARNDLRHRRLPDYSPQTELEAKVN
jgi:hypothetical protein